MTRTDLVVLAVLHPLLPHTPVIVALVGKILAHVEPVCFAGVVGQNVAEDHLGEYGINTVRELADAKFIVSKALTKGGVLVVNADDQNTVAHPAVKGDYETVWFSLQSDNPISHSLSPFQYPRLGSPACGLR